MVFTFLTIAAKTQDRVDFRKGMFAGSFYFCSNSPSYDKAEFKGEIASYDIIGIDEFINVFNKALEWGKLNKTEKMFFSKDLIPQGNFSSGHCSLIFNGSDYGTCMLQY